MSGTDSSPGTLAGAENPDTVATPTAAKPVKAKRKRGGRSRKPRAGDTVKVAALPDPAEEGPLPETKLVLELDGESSVAMLALESGMVEQRVAFRTAEVTAEVDLLEQVPTTQIVRGRATLEIAEETITLDEPDEVLEDLPPSPKAPPRGVTPPPHPSKSAPQIRLAAPQEPRSWWEHFFNDDYLRSVRPLRAEQVKRQCDFIESRLALEPRASILDVGCGIGVQAVELASRGYAVVGLDISLPMLSRASEEAQDREQRLNFLHADMRELSFESAFDAVICWGTSFGYFDDETNRQVLERLYRTLKPRGRMVLGIVNRDFVVRSQPNVVWFEGDGCLCMEETSFDYIASRLNVKRTLLMEDGRQRESGYSLRLYTLQEIGQLLHHQGFSVQEVSGSEATPGVFFGADSPQMLIIAERRGDVAFSAPTAGDEWEEETVSPSRPTLVDSVPPFSTADEATPIER